LDSLLRPFDYERLGVGTNETKDVAIQQKMCCGEFNNLWPIHNCFMISAVGLLY
jgi:hypothetical protein